MRIPTVIAALGLAGALVLAPALPALASDTCPTTSSCGTDMPKDPTPQPTPQKPTPQQPTPQQPTPQQPTPQQPTPQNPQQPQNPPAVVNPPVPPASQSVPGHTTSNAGGPTRATTPGSAARENGSTAASAQQHSTASAAREAAAPGHQPAAAPAQQPAAPGQHPAPAQQPAAPGHESSPASSPVPAPAQSPSVLLVLTGSVLAWRIRKSVKARAQEIELLDQQFAAASTKETTPVVTVETTPVVETLEAPLVEAPVQVETSLVEVNAAEVTSEDTVSLEENTISAEEMAAFDAIVAGLPLDFYAQGALVEDRKV